MTPVHQTTFGDGSDGSEPGNCMSACLASVLDLPVAEVPNFAALGQNGYFKGLCAWLLARGLYLFETDEDPSHTPGTPDYLNYIASGKSPRGLHHAVVMSEGVIVHDPHPSNAGLAEAPTRFYILGRLT